MVGSENTVARDQYQSWAEHDKDQVDELFHTELQQAILLSKVESEKQVNWDWKCCCHTRY